ncbi:hypothetical protein [Spirosoma arcticum]
MRTHQELIEEIYNDTNFRNEFISYAKLWFTLQTEQQLRPKAPAAPNPDGVNFISYNDLLIKPKIEPDSALVAKCKRGISFLYSSLARALYRTYQLDSEETRQLIFAVAARHIQSINF